MKRPNITPGDWQTANDFPGCVISGQVEQSPRGKSAMVVCKVQGSCLPTYKANLAAIAAVPELLAALEALVRESGRSMDDLDSDVSSHRPLIAAYEALTKAGYEFS